MGNSLILGGKIPNFEKTPSRAAPSLPFHNEIFSTSKILAIGEIAGILFHIETKGWRLLQLSY
jgi:hypothetical protein